MRKTFVALAAMSALACGSANASIDNYFASLLGANEVPAGDIDGFGSALLAIDNVANTVSWAILALGIEMPLTGAHIHQAPAGVNGSVIVNFSAALIGATLADADLALITPASAAGFYVNLHNATYPGGAIRGQLQYVGTVAAPGLDNVTAPVPEPETYALMLAGLGVVGFVVSRRRRVAA